MNKEYKNKELTGISYEKDFLGDSSKLYGEEYLVNSNGDVEIDPLTNKPIAASYMETNGDRIFNALFDAASEKADDPEEIAREYEKMVTEQAEYRDELQNRVDNQLELGGLKQESLDTVGQKHASDVFNKQERHFQQIMEQEREEYKDNFEKLTEKITVQEKILNEVTERFNNHDPNDKEGKIELYNEIHRVMNELVTISYNYGRSIDNIDTDDAIGSLSAYDTFHNEGDVNKYIKEL